MVGVITDINVVQTIRNLESSLKSSDKRSKKRQNGGDKSLAISNAINITPACQRAAIVSI